MWLIIRCRLIHIKKINLPIIYLSNRDSVHSPYSTDVRYIYTGFALQLSVLCYMLQVHYCGPWTTISQLPSSHFPSVRSSLRFFSGRSSYRIGCLFHITTFVLIYWWGISTRQQLQVRILLLSINDFSRRYPLWPKQGISESKMGLSSSWVESFSLSDPIILTLEPF